jgi:hypothetical protein
MTRQRRWQLKQQAAGRCIICGRPRAKGNARYCGEHRANHRDTVFNSEYERKRKRRAAARAQTEGERR